MLTRIGTVVALLLVVAAAAANFYTDPPVPWANPNRPQSFAFLNEGPPAPESTPVRPTRVIPRPPSDLPGGVVPEETRYAPNAVGSLQAVTAE